MSKATQRGFTLIELVVVIVILGILAAFAVPRFISLESQARVAALDALRGSVLSASALSHSLYLASGSTSPVSMEGQSIVMVNGYPDRATIDNTLAQFTGFTYNETTGVFSKDGAPTPANCSFTYTAPAAADTPPTIPAPTVTGC
jgi:MSHA pilin protein MshA